ncbi:hypothetical protein G6F21_014638 [Rhizopus arrhizus]|nr:hypothetical protein G6F21_014638 [Rhizopus arrhizus]KAG0919967.1 hypothetical protein G6F31_020918 [Rhizopus arrhizus]
MTPSRPRCSKNASAMAWISMRPSGAALCAQAWRAGRRDPDRDRLAQHRAEPGRSQAVDGSAQPAPGDHRQ